GNTIVIKPAEDAPLTALALARLALDAGIPPGVVNVVIGYGVEAGAAIPAHPGISRVSFTGSPATGSAGEAAVARHPHPPPPGAGRQVTAGPARRRRHRRRDSPTDPQHHPEHRADLCGGFTGRRRPEDPRRGGHEAGRGVHTDPGRAGHRERRYGTADQREAA